MKNSLIPTTVDFIRKENINMKLSEDNPSGFWLDDTLDSITVRFKVDDVKHKILYDVYSPKFSIHLNEKTLKDVEQLEFLAEENRNWEIAEIIEDVWLILDEIKIWAIENNFMVMEKKLI